MKKQLAYRYKFSFVIPVYNVENYLAETVDSILAQSMNFERNCEIVFVNDGSTDKSEAVCLEYIKKYPNNTLYLKQKNAGLSATRNAGVKKARGKYVMFIDADDKLSPGATQEVYPFFEEHADEIDLVALKMVFFEAKTGQHVLNYRFSKTRVINVDREPSMPQIAGASVFFKKELFNTGFKFDESVKKYGEDTKFLTEVILEIRAYGVVKHAIYYYRQRQDGGSIMGGSRKDRDWYLKTPRIIEQMLIDYAKKKFKTVPPYVQYILGYDLQWRIKQQDQRALTPAEVKEYKNILWGILNNVSDDMIMAQRFASLEYKLFLLGKKYNEVVADKAIPNEKGEFFYRNHLVYRPEWREKNIRIDKINFQGNQIVLGGLFNDVVFRDTRLQYRINQRNYDVTLIKKPNKGMSFLGEPICQQIYAEAKLPFSESKPVTVHLILGSKSIALPFVPDEKLGFDGDNKWAYKNVQNYLVIFRPGEIIAQKKTAYRSLIRALKSKAYLYQRANPQSPLAGLAARLFRI